MLTGEFLGVQACGCDEGDPEVDDPLGGVHPQVAQAAELPVLPQSAARRHNNPLSVMQQGQIYSEQIILVSSAY